MLRTVSGWMALYTYSVGMHKHTQPLIPTYVTCTPADVDQHRISIYPPGSGDRARLEVPLHLAPPVPTMQPRYVLPAVDSFQKGG